MDFLRQLFGRHDAGPEPATCPDCNEQLGHEEGPPEVHVRRCPKCRGSWLSFDAFEKIGMLEDREIQPFDEPADTPHTLKSSPSPRACPNCKELMVNFLFRHQIWLDWCPEGHGLWLDRGELALVHHIRGAAEHLSPEEREHVLRGDWRV